MMAAPLSKLSWDDLRIIKAIGESGALAAAAKVLGVNNTTMSRRLSLVEETLGVTLFDRRRAGYVPTPAGAELMALAERVELDIVGTVRRMSGHAHAGNLRVTTNDVLLGCLTSIIAGFQADNPSIRVEVIVSNDVLNLARGESDVAFRAATRPPSDNLYGRKIATIAWAAYGRRVDFIGGWPSEIALYQQQQWVAYGPRLAGLLAAQFTEQRVPEEKLVYRSDSVMGVSAAIRAGIGVGFLPCVHGDTTLDLIRVGPVIPEISDELWVLTHPDIRKSGRVYAFMTYCIQAISRQRSLIEGNDKNTS